MSPPRKLAYLALVMLAFIFEGEFSRSFVLEGPDWPTGIAGFRVNPTFPVATGGTAAQQVEAIRCAASAWRNQGTTNFNFNYLGQTVTTTVNTGDNNNAVFYTAQNSGDAAAATTFYSFVGSNFVGFDMVFWGANSFQTFTWNGVGDSVGNQTDIIGIGVHEFGHALGLGHTTANGATMEASFSGTGMPLRTLHTDDIAGVQSLYGVNASISDNPAINSVTPPDGPVGGGNEVIITGANFTWTGNTSLSIGGVGLPSSQFSVDSCSTLRIPSMPAHAAGPVSISISNALGSVTLTSAYFYGNAAPVIQQVTPNAGTAGGGTPVQIIGTNFSPDATVFFGVTPLTNAQFVNSSLITGLTPAGAPGPIDVLVAQAAGSSTLTNGFTYTNNVLRIENATVTAGATGVVVRALADHNQPLAGFSFGVDMDANLITPTAVTLAGTSAQGAGFFDGAIDPGPEPGGWVTVGVVFDLFSVNTIPAANNDPIARIELSISPFAQSGFPLILQVTDAVGAVPVDVCFVPPTGLCFAPDTVPGILQVVEGSLFIRGDSNGDLAFNIADPVSCLSYLFSMGPADCLDALDCNDDGTVNIADAVFSLSNLFQMGPNPPAPFPNPGIDPTLDLLDCNF
ncbi:MAG: IPT/TIG domain-containing protein [Planctomycetota bacterium]